MEEPFCNQAKAYPSKLSAEEDVDAVIVYDQLKESIESVERSLGADDGLSVLWYGPAGTRLTVERIGYQGQAFLVFSGKDEEGVENTTLVRTNLVQVLLQTTKQAEDKYRISVTFIGHTVSVG